MEGGDRAHLVHTTHRRAGQRAEQAGCNRADLRVRSVDLQVSPPYRVYSNWQFEGFSHQTCPPLHPPPPPCMPVSNQVHGRSERISTMVVFRPHTSRSVAHHLASFPFQLPPPPSHHAMPPIPALALQSGYAGGHPLHSHPTSPISAIPPRQVKVLPRPWLRLLAVWQSNTGLDQH
jgi:hypothetical protein